MFKGLINKLRREYQIRFLHVDPMEYKISLMRKEGYKIGENCKLYSMLGTAEPYLVNIGNNVTVSFNVNVLTHDNSPIKVIDGATDIVGKIVIGNNCFIGAGSLIIAGVELSDDTIVAAGSVVTKSVKEPRKIIGGNPAKILGTWEEFRNKNKEYCFNFDGMSRKQKREFIESNTKKHIRRSKML